MTSFQALFSLKRFLSLFEEYKFNLLRFLFIKLNELFNKIKTKTTLIFKSRTISQW